MSCIEKIFIPGYKALIPYITVGYPNIEATLKAAVLLADCGCNIIELGMPFSDPLADGVTIQRASYHAIKRGITPQMCIEAASELNKIIDIPLVFMGYYNPIFNSGLEEFCRLAEKAGIEGLIVPDMPPEEGLELEEYMRKYGLDSIYLLSPTSSPERISLVAERSTGFIYLVSLTGVTGARKNLPVGLESFIVRVRERTNLPLCVGFGISTPEQAGKIAKIADGVIIGSRIIQLMEEDCSLASLKSFVLSIREAIDKR